MEPPNYESTVRFSFAASPPDAPPGPSRASAPSSGNASRPANNGTHAILRHRGRDLFVPLRKLTARLDDGTMGIANFILLSDVQRAVPTATGLVDAHGWQVASELDEHGVETLPCRWRLPDLIEDPQWRVFVPDKRDRPRSGENTDKSSSRKLDDKQEKERKSAAAYASALEHSVDAIGSAQTLGINGDSTSPGSRSPSRQGGQDLGSGQGSSPPDSVRASSSEFPRYVGRSLPSLRERDLQDVPPEFEDQLDLAAADEEEDNESDSGRSSDSLNKSNARSHEAIESRLSELSTQMTTMHHSLSDRMQAILMRLHTIYNRLGTLEASQRGGGGGGPPQLPALPPRVQAPQPSVPNGAPPPFISTPPPQEGFVPPIPFRNEGHATLPPAFRENPRPPVQPAQPAKSDPPPPYFAGRE